MERLRPNQDDFEDSRAAEVMNMREQLLMSS